MTFDVHDVTNLWDGQPRHIKADATGSTPLVGMLLLDRHNLNIEVERGGLGSHRGYGIAGGEVRILPGRRDGFAMRSCPQVDAHGLSRMRSYICTMIIADRRQTAQG